MSNGSKSAEAASGARALIPFEDSSRKPRRPELVEGAHLQYISMPTFPITPRAVRYIKLGVGGRWEQSCRDEGILRFGFETAHPDSMAQCRGGLWDQLASGWQAARKSKGRGTTDANEIRTYWTDPGDILWVTFIGDDLCWGFLEPGEPKPYSPDDPTDLSTFRRVRGGWRNVDALGNRLGKSNLPGFITKVAAFRGTSCSVEGSDRLVARINGVKTPEVERLVTAKHELRDALIPLLQNLDPKDFEILIDMMFSRAGWRRVGHVGRATKDKDLDLEMPLTGEMSFVQIKAEAKQSDLNDYVERKKQMRSYDRMFFVYHTSQNPLQKVAEDGITILDAAAVADLSIESGLVDWIIDRVY